MREGKGESKVSGEGKGGVREGIQYDFYSIFKLSAACIFFFFFISSWRAVSEMRGGLTLTGTKVRQVRWDYSVRLSLVVYLCVTCPAQVCSV